MTVIDAPAPSTWANYVRERRNCQADYGGVKCNKPAKWRIVMACCGHNDFLCHECLSIAQAPLPPQAVKEDVDYFGCEGCATLHPSWNSAVKEVTKL